MAMGVHKRDRFRRFLALQINKKTGMDQVAVSADPDAFGQVAIFSISIDNSIGGNKTA